MDHELDSVFVSEEDFIFFQGLSDEEKILCTFDLWVYPTEENNGLNEDGFLNNDAIKDIIDFSIQKEDKANVVIFDDSLVINANKYKDALEAVKTFFESGLIMERMSLTPDEVILFQRQKHCIVYYIMGNVTPINFN